MADDAVIKLRLDLDAAKKDLKNLREEMRKVSKQGNKSSVSAGGGTAAAVRGGAFTGSFAGGLAGGAAALALSKIAGMVSKIAETLLPNTISAIESLEPSEQAFQKAAQIAEQAGRLGIAAPQGALNQLFETERAAGQRGLAAKARFRETTALSRAGDVLNVVPAVGVGVSKDAGFLMEAAIKAITSSGTKR